MFIFLPFFFLLFLFFFSLDRLVPGCIINVGSLVIFDLLDRFNFATKLSAVKFCVDVDLNVLTMLLLVLGVSARLYRLALFDLDGA